MGFGGRRLELILSVSVSSHLSITKFIALRSTHVVLLMNLLTPKSKLFNKTVIQKQGKTWWRVVERSILHIRKPMLYPTELRAL